MDTESRQAGDDAAHEPGSAARPYTAPAAFVPHSLDTVRLGIVGLGYVGLPLAVEFGKKYATLGFDINSRRITSCARATMPPWKWMRMNLPVRNACAFHPVCMTWPSAMCTS